MDIDNITEEMNKIDEYLNKKEFGSTEKYVLAKMLHEEYWDDLTSGEDEEPEEEPEEITIDGEEFEEEPEPKEELKPLKELAAPEEEPKEDITPGELSEGETEKTDEANELMENNPPKIVPPKPKKKRPGPHKRDPPQSRR